MVFYNFEFSSCFLIAYLHTISFVYSYIFSYGFYLRALLNALINSHSFLGWIIISFCVLNYLICEWRQLASFKKNLYTFFSSCLISLTWTFSAMFNRQDESRYPCFVLDLGGEVIFFSTIECIITTRYFRCSLVKEFSF